MFMGLHRLKFSRLVKNGDCSLDAFIDNKIMRYLTLIILLSSIPILFPHQTLAAEASLFFSSGHGVYQGGKDFSTRLMVNSGGGKGINAVKVEFKFDPKMLKIKSIGKDNSIFKFWPEDVKFDNKKGVLNFVGGTPTSYKEGAGKILDINFTLVTRGKVSLVYATSSVILSAEASPKNILKETRPANFTIGTESSVNSALILAQKLSGRILLQVESKGEAWYVYPNDSKKYYLGRPSDAFNIMRKLGLGVKHSIITKNKIFPLKLSGKILLDTEDKGKAYYINPTDRKAYYLGRPADAFQVMREKGLGIRNEEIFKVKDWVI